MLIPIISYSQLPYINRNYIFSMPWYNMGSTILTTDKGFITSSMGGVDSITRRGGVVITEFDSLGNVLYCKTYGKDSMTLFPGFDGSFCKIGNKGYAIGGSIGFNGYTGLGYLMRLNVNGDSLWTKVYGNPNIWNIFDFCRPTIDGGFILSGHVNIDTNTLDCDIWLLKTDSLGNVEWEKTYNIAIFDRAWSLILTSDNGYLIAGYSENPTDGFSRNAFLLKTDSIGNFIWKRSIGGNLQDGYANVCSDGRGNYLVAYHAGVVQEYPNDEVKNKIAVCLIDSLGNIKWEKKYGSPEYFKYVRQIQAFNDGTFLINGTKLIVRFLMKVNIDGDSLWYREYAYDITNDTIHSRIDCTIAGACTLEDGGVLACGSSFYLEPADLEEQLWVIRTDEYGCVVPNCQVYDKVDEQQNAGYINIYPNPANNYINFTAQDEGLITIYSINGRKILSSDYKNSQETMSIDISSLSSAMYFVEFISKGNIIETIKFVKE